MNFDLTTIVLIAIPTILAITLHEAAHGYVARVYGDRTAEMLGRITLNPIKHIDLVGTILVPGTMILMAKAAGFPPFIFGWAKPVPINTGNFKDPIRNMRWVALAGPLSNLSMAVGWALVGKIALFFPGVLSAGLATMATYGIYVNVLLMVLNLFPLLPLDGGRVLYSVLPWQYATQYRRLEPYGIWILLLLLVSGALGAILQPFMRIVLTVIHKLIGF